VAIIDTRPVTLGLMNHLSHSNHNQPVRVKRLLKCLHWLLRQVWHISIMHAW